MVLPESPRWLARKGRWEEALDVLALVHGKGDRSSPWVAKEYEEIKEYCEMEAANKDVTYWELFTPRNINRTHIGLFTQIWSQLTGVYKSWTTENETWLIESRHERHDVLHHIRKSFSNSSLPT